MDTESIYQDYITYKYNEIVRSGEYQQNGVKKLVITKYVQTEGLFRRYELVWYFSSIST